MSNQEDHEMSGLTTATASALSILRPRLDTAHVGADASHFSSLILAVVKQADYSRVHVESSRGLKVLVLNKLDGVIMLHLVASLALSSLYL